MLLRDAEARARVKNTSSSSCNTTTRTARKKMCMHCAQNAHIRMRSVPMAGKTVRLAALVSCENAIVAARQLTWLSTRVTSSFLNLAIIIEATANIKSPAIVTYKEKKTHISKRNHILFEIKKLKKQTIYSGKFFDHVITCDNVNIGGFLKRHNFLFASVSIL